MNRQGKRIALVALVAVACLCSSAPAEQKTVKQTFRESSFTTWKIVGGGFAEGYCKVTPAGLLCELGVGEGVQHCGARAKFKVHGDFTVILGYRLLDVPQPDKGYGAGVLIVVGDEQKRVASVQRVNVTSGKRMYKAHRAVPQEDGTFQNDVKASPSQVDFGKLKFERKGDVLTWSAAEGDFDNSDNFVVLRSEPFSNADITELFLRTENGGATTGMQALLTEVEVTADDLVLPAPSNLKGAEDASSTKNQPSVKPAARPLSPVLVGSTVFAFLALISIIVYLIRRNQRRA